MSDSRQFSILLEQLALVRKYGLDIHAVEEDGEKLLEIEDTSEFEFLEGRDFTWLMRQEDLLETLAEIKKRKDELWDFLRGYSGGAE